MNNNDEHNRLKPMDMKSICIMTIKLLAVIFVTVVVPLVVLANIITPALGQ